MPSREGAHRRAGGDRRGPARRRRLLPQQVAALWFVSPDTSWPFSFENICAALELDAGALRQRLRVAAPRRRYRSGGAIHPSRAGPTPILVEARDCSTRHPGSAPPTAGAAPLPENALELRAATAEKRAGDRGRAGDVSLGKRMEERAKSLLGPLFTWHDTWPPS